jgi:excinuclease UvrABC nuclease subunit
VNNTTHTTVKDLEALFARLTKAKRFRLPKQGDHLTGAPAVPGVYIIWSPRSKRALHVGKSSRRTLHQRLSSHLRGHAKFQGSKLRRGYEFQCLEVKSTRKRALLEAYTIGRLCPTHLGTGAKKAE